MTDLTVVRFHVRDNLGRAAPAQRPDPLRLAIVSAELLTRRRCTIR